MEKKIKITYLIDTFFIGGAERLLLDICRKIDRNRFEVQVWAVVCGGPLEKDFKSLGIPVKVFKKKSRLGLGLIGQLCKELKQTKPDIVHTHLFGADTWGRLAAVLAKVPVIISTEHNMNLDYGWLKKIIKLVLSLFTDKIVAVSQAVKEYSVAKGKIKAAKIAVIYNGIDLTRFKFRGYHKIEPAKISAGVLARLAEQKGHKYLIEAIPLILAKYPGFTLHIWGEGALRSELQVQAKDLAVSKNVMFQGKTGQPEKVLPQLDLFIFPSVWEGLGIAVLEAQAVGLPVVASRIPGVDELIKNKETGLLFAPKDPRAIAAAVLAVLDNEQLQQKIVKQAHDQVQTKFSLEKMVNSYSNLYLDLIKHD